MAENRNQNQEQNRGGQQSNLGGSQPQRGNQSTQRQGLDEDLQQDVSTGGNQQSGRMGQGSQEQFDSESESLRSGQQGSSERGSSGSSGLGNR